MVGVGRESSLIVPLRVPNSLPPYVHLNLSSAWHRSALLATAVETASLPSRLKAISTSQPRTFSYLMDTLNPQGNHPVATVELSAHPRNLSGSSNGAPQAEQHTNGRGLRGSPEEVVDPDAALDMNLTTWAEEAQDRGRRARSAHVETFGQFVVSREATESARLGPNRAYSEQSEVKGLSVMRKYVLWPSQFTLTK